MKKCIRKIAEFKEPIIAATPAEREQAERRRDERLALVMGQLNVDVAHPEHYKEFCITLLADVLGLEGFRILRKAPKHPGGAPVVWTLERHDALVKFVNNAVRNGCRSQRAIGQARDLLSAELHDPDLTDGRVKAEFHRAQRFFFAVPRTAASILALGRGQEQRAFSDFAKSGIEVSTNYGVQKVTTNHIADVRQRRDDPQRQPCIVRHDDSQNVSDDEFE